MNIQSHQVLTSPSPHKGGDYWIDSPHTDILGCLLFPKSEKIGPTKKPTHFCFLIKNITLDQIIIKFCSPIVIYFCILFFAYILYVCFIAQILYLKIACFD